MMRRLLTTLAGGFLIAGGLVVGAASTASAAGCYAPGIGKAQDPRTGASMYFDDRRCGQISDPTLPPPVHNPPPKQPDPTASDGCLEGVVGDIACDRPRGTSGGGGGAAPDNNAPVTSRTTITFFPGPSHRVTGTVTVGPVTPVGGDDNKGTVTIGEITSAE